jgi:hypothetical protein
VSVPVGVFASGAVTFYALKGQEAPAA